LNRIHKIDGISMTRMKTLALVFCILMVGVTSSEAGASPLRAPAPTVTSVLPNQAVNNLPSAITVTGTNFVDPPTAHMNNVPLTNVTFVNSTTLTATVPADLAGGVYTLTVTNPDTQSASLLNGFTALMYGNGVLGTWQTTSSMTSPRRYASAVISGNHIYALGGESEGGGASLSSVEVAVINNDGSLGSWQATASMTNGRVKLAAAQADGNIYALGPHSGGPDPSVEWATINADGSLSPWQTTSSMSITRASLAVVSSRGYIYAIGGNDLVGHTLATVEFAPINPDGTLGAWQPTSSMITERSTHAAVVVNNYIYVLGGTSTTIGSLNTVERALINSNGSLGTWQAATSMITARCYPTGVTMHGYIYVIAGAGCTVPLPVYATTERTMVDVDGSLSPWQFVHPLLSPRSMHSAVQNGKYIYAIGGSPDYNLTVNSVERVQVDPLLFFLPFVRE
jgi:hypothetical protein